MQRRIADCDLVPCRILHGQPVRWRAVLPGVGGEPRGPVGRLQAKHDRHPARHDCPSVEAAPPCPPAPPSVLAADEHDSTSSPTAAIRLIRIDILLTFGRDGPSSQCLGRPASFGRRWIVFLAGVPSGTKTGGTIMLNEQGRSDLRSRRCDRRRGRARVCARGGQALSHRAPPGAGRGGRQGDRLGRRLRRGGGGRRARRAGRGRASAVRDRKGGPRRHLVQRGRDRAHEDSGRASGRAGCRAVLPADHGLHAIVLPDRAPGGPADGREQSGRDHDRHRPARADGQPIAWRLRVRRRAPRRRSFEVCPPSSRRTAFAWSVLRAQGMPETRTLKEAFEFRAKLRE